MQFEPSDLAKITFHPEPPKRLCALLMYCGAGILINFFCMQVFCTPVWYATIMCIAFFIALTSYPFTRSKLLKSIFQFCLGMGVPICIYCFLFLADPFALFSNYIYFTLEVLLMGLGLFAFIPFYLLFHIYKYFIASTFPGRAIIALGAIIPLVALFIYLANLKQYLREVEKIAIHVHSADEFFEKIPANYFTERNLGAHWKYHTRLCYMYDGWRPPLNDPFFIISLWVAPLLIDMEGQKQINKYEPLSLSNRIKYYKRLFPNNPLKANCACSYNQSGREYLSVNLDSLKN